jgi:hypothetical protein
VRLTALTAAGAIALAAAAPATALDDAKPSAPCGSQFKDKPGDTAAVAGTSGSMDSVDFVGGFVKYDAAKGAEATTVNLAIKDLGTTPPTGSNGMTWLARFGTAEGERWVRAFADFAGLVAYEYGHYEPTAATEFSIRDGATPGKLFEGPDGIVQLVVPEAWGKPGAELKGLTGQASVNRTVLPASAPTPVRGGFTFEANNMGGGSWKVAPCSAVPAPSTGAGGAVKPSVPATATPVGSGPLPVKLLTKSTRSLKKGRRLALKVSAKERVTGFAVQVVSRGRQLALGRLGSLKGTRTVRLKLRSALKRGTYVIDMRGTTASGEHRLASYRLKVR